MLVHIFATQAKKKVKVGWRLNNKGKRVARSVAYGVSEVSHGQCSDQ